LFFLSMVPLCCFFASETALSQAGAGDVGPKSRVALIKLAPPIYPPLARQAQITGNVRVQIEVYRDGSVASAEMVSGHPMLKQAALDSAKQSHFECVQCENELTQYLLTYTFQIVGTAGKGCCTAGTKAAKRQDEERQRGPQVSQVQNHVTIAVGPLCVCTMNSAGPQCGQTRIN
jgi:TonB family protein